MSRKTSKIQYGLKCLSCEDEIYSNSVHDFKYCKCGNIFIDGGFDYQRCGFNNGENSFKQIERENPWYEKE